MDLNHPYANIFLGKQLIFVHPQLVSLLETFFVFTIS